MSLGIDPSPLCAVIVFFPVHITSCLYSHSGLLIGPLPLVFLVRSIFQGPEVVLNREQSV